MLNQGHSDFTYWKHSWHKWGILVAAILQLLALWMNIREYSNISRIGILSTVEWTSYASQKYWQCAINIVLIICFLGTFLIGAFARSRKGARLGEAFLLLLLAFAWGAVFLDQQIHRILWNGHQTHRGFRLWSGEHHLSAGVADILFTDGYGLVFRVQI